MQTPMPYIDLPEPYIICIIS